MLAWEWSRLCNGQFGVSGVVLAVMAVIVAVFGRLAPASGLLVVLAGALLVGTPARNQYLLTSSPP